MMLACPLMSGHQKPAYMSASLPLATTTLKTYQTVTALERIRAVLTICMWVLRAALLMASVVLTAAQQALQMTQ